MARWHCFGIAVGLTALMGCGNPTPDGPVSGNATGSTDALVSPPTDDSAAHESAREAPPTQTAPLGPTVQQASTPAASPVPLASGLTPADHDEARPAEPLVVPAWIAKELDSPDVHVRLHALDQWGQQGAAGSVDPLLLALEDEDELVQARALALIEQDWVRAQAEEK